MKARSIKSILHKKFDAWLNSITDESLRAKIERDSIITGGSIASMLLNEDVVDYDVYFTSATTAADVARYYVKQFQSVDEENVEVLTVDGRVSLAGPGLGVDARTRMDRDDVEDTGAQEAVNDAKSEGKYQVVFLSPNAITLTDQIQIVIRFTGDADNIHENYDFVHCTNYWTSKDGELTLRPAALEALLAKELRYVGSKYPLCSIIRTRKFIRRGWQINAGQYLKMALQLNELDLFDIETLQDQLVGVDSAHFISLIESIRNGCPEKINAQYICELIDRIF